MRVPHNKLKISEVFEIGLRIDHMREIVKLAKMHKVTLSWITRVCIFRLIEDYENRMPEIQLGDAAEKEDLQEAKEKRQGLHRHMLCLYGKDSVRIRYLASKLRLTITQFVRIALILFISTLSVVIDKKVLVEIGIKFVVSIIENLNNYTKIWFEQEDYWAFKPCFGGRLFFR